MTNKYCSSVQCNGQLRHNRSLLSNYASPATEQRRRATLWCGQLQLYTTIQLCTDEPVNSCSATVLCNRCLPATATVETVADKLWFYPSLVPRRKVKHKNIYFYYSIREEAGLQDFNFSRATRTNQLHDISWD